MEAVHYAMLVVLSLPPLVAAAALIWKQERLLGWIDNTGDIVRLWRGRSDAGQGRVLSWARRGLPWPFIWVHERSAAMTDKCQRAAVRALGHGYLAISILAAVGFLAYVVFMVVVTLLMLGAMLWLIGKALSGDDDGRSESSASSHRSVSGTSHARQGLFGDRYVEHLDDDGRKIGESRLKTGFLGTEYVEHTDAQGKVVGESEVRTGFLGDSYVAHLDRDGQAAGESREVQGLFGDSRIEHIDRDGAVTGHSSSETDWLGKEFTRRSAAN